jgi:formylglycine-generating enzyme required for sulfatase activity
MAKNWAICVGINQYRFLQDLTCAVNDAEKMHLWLKETANFEQTYLFTDKSPEIDDMSEPLPSQPTFTTLRRWLRKRFERPILSPSDSLWFFFSGHGVREQGQDYLLLHDSDPDPEEVNNSAISLAFVTEQLRQSGAGNIMMFVDACRSVSKSGLGIELQSEQGIISIASCRPEQKSYEIEALGHGSFTYALLESLQIQGENNCATVERLCKRLKDRVLEINREHKKPVQTPYTRIEPETKNHLIFLPERIQPTRQDIATLRENALKAEIENDLNLAAFLWDRLVIHDRDEALKNLRRIWNKLDQQGTNSTVSLSSQSVQTSSAKQSESAKDTFLKSSPQILTETLPGNIKLEMVKIPAGSFLMGSPNNDGSYSDREKPQHQVNLREFYLGKYPLTQEQYRAIMGNNPSEFRDNPKNPVEKVSWDDAQAFCQQLNQKTGKNYRLPSEAEWEYACRAGSQTRYYFGDDEKQLSEYAWYRENSNSKTHPVGQKKPNNWELHDMSGNVWEWCEDDWHQNHENAPKDGSSWNDFSSQTNPKLLRGGSWHNDLRNCRSANRGRGNVVSSYYDIGFRLALFLF